MSAIIDSLFAYPNADSASQSARIASLVAEISPLIERSCVVALAVDNGESWLACDFSCMKANKVCIPLPEFFTRNQLQWAMDIAGVDTLITDHPTRVIWQDQGFDSLVGKSGSLHVLSRNVSKRSIPENTAKITFTSGSTGNPKGVCLSLMTQELVAESVAKVMLDSGIKRHLCALPLPVLLENVAGVYAARIAGAECYVPSLTKAGWSGSSKWNPAVFLQQVQEHQIHSAIILPQMLNALLPVCRDFDLSSLKLLAVGGGVVAPDLLQTARNRGIPVYEGYGLSECGSVVCLNTPHAYKSGTVGKPLPHVNVRINVDGELEVATGYAVAQYLGQDKNDAAEWLSTGDLACVDSDGFITIMGRKKNLLISSFGRNISPEWPESELLAQSGVLQAAVFGEARPYLVAVIVAPGLTEPALCEAVDQANKILPDYARIRKVVRATQPFNDVNGLATSNGRNKREAIQAFYQDRINTLYEEEITP